MIRREFAEWNQRELADRFDAGESVTVDDDGQSYVVEPEDVEVRRTPRAGLAVAEDGGYLVAVTTTLTPALELEGQARELVRRIQQLRKDSDLDISDRIRLTLPDSPLMGSLLSAHKSYIMAETLTLEIELTTKTAEVLEGESVTFSLGEEEAIIGLSRA